ncbi:ATP citrate synthase [Malassezia vespertilionis]|uniref:ATP-citrate synthase n=1 Tax=Malassezia vespertilionis TaxID=2020962 RepID=A0A2N1JB97_9BASI|nr:ATP citrate synthase [Malassezia vespertilionis]PKI83816.1 Acl1p [Malassezia vespertilionis]WFD07064.1 ATP citrate synthase [Malassezia vespertilionis]
MSSKPIHEIDAKLLINYWLPRAPDAHEKAKASAAFVAPTARAVQVAWDADTNTLTFPDTLPSWVHTTKLVVKPDQLIKRRGKAGLLKLDADWNDAQAWIAARAGKAQQVESVTGTLNNFIVEPFCPHGADEEFYVCINSAREGDYLLFTHEGGVDVGDVDTKAKKLLIPANPELPFPDRATWVDTLLPDVSADKKDALTDFLMRLYSVYVDLHFAYLEINPLVMTKEKNIYYLDMAAKLDQTADFICGPKWAIARDPSVYNDKLAQGAVRGEDRGPPMVWPPPFGRDLTPEEAYIAKLDAGTGASLKLTVLNPAGRIWTMVAGGGASVVYSDAIAAHGYANELANYGEYSGAPTETQTFEYAKTVLDLITRGEPHPDGKTLIIGGGIANFTNVAATFKGIIRALKQYQLALAQHSVRIFVRRGGPNYQEGLRAMRLLGDDLGVQIKVFGPETHITDIVPLALGLKTEAQIEQDSKPPLISQPEPVSANETADVVEERVGAVNPHTGERVQPQDQIVQFDTAAGPDKRPWYLPFDENTRALIYGLQPRAIQGMLDFDFSCGRAVPSVAAMIYPFGGHHIQKFYWGTKETLLPVYTSVAEAAAKHRDADVVVNFASSRSVYASTLEVLRIPQIRALALIAEGVPERHAREILWRAQHANVLVIGPATVGGIKPGCFRIGNSGGMMDNIVASKLYRPGSVGYVSKSGGMSNELNNILSINSNGTYEGVAIGGDRYPATTFLDHLLRYEKDVNCKMLLLLGEVGGVEEYRVIDAVKQGRITKPIVAWAIGTCADMFATEVQFGHAGSMANSTAETAVAKNAAMRAAGFIVPDTFEDLPKAVRETYERLVRDSTIVPKPERPPPAIPMDYKWAQELGLVRKPAAFISTISDERGAELMYSGVKISDVFDSEMGIGGVVSLLWFKRPLPPVCTKFIEMALMLTADHGPAVSGAMNTIITSRAGKDLISSLVAGLLTIGDRFGGALDNAAREFAAAYDCGLTPREFVDAMRKANKLIPGIGHRIKSVSNPDYRVQVVKDYVMTNFESHKMLDYALAVERVTTAKKETLILNVDGCIAVCFVDLLRESGAFTREEADEYMQIGVLNGLFTLGRTVGFIGHHLDQKRLKTPLYRHPADDFHIEMSTPSRIVGNLNP